MTSLLTGRLSDREVLSGNNMVFSIDLDAPLDFMAGQYVRVIIEDDNLDRDERSRFLSIASAPSHQESLMFSMKMTGSKFKRYLMSAAKGAKMSVEGPRGRFTLRKNSRSPAIFITDSIGIPPVRGILEDASRRKLRQRIYLFYLLRHKDWAMFIDDISGFQRKNGRISVFRIDDDQDDSASDHSEMIRESVGEDFDRSMFYVCGPPFMVASVKRSLTSCGVESSRIVMEGFSGY